MMESRADLSVYRPSCPDLSVRATTMCPFRRMLIQMDTLSASGVWADTCLESLIVGQLGPHHRHPVSPTIESRRC